MLDELRTGNMRTLVIRHIMEKYESGSENEVSLIGLQHFRYYLSDEEFGKLVISPSKLGNSSFIVTIHPQDVEYFTIVLNFAKL